MNKHPKSERSLEELRAARTAMLDQLAHLSEPNSAIYLPDIVLGGIVDRALAIAKAFEQAHIAGNYVVSSILLRSQIDTAMRTYGFFLVPNFDDACDHVFKGTRYNKLKDKQGNRLQDHYLIKRIGEHYPWMPNVYENTSGFVHFSNKNIHTTLQHVGSEGRVDLSIGGGGDAIPKEIFDELAAAFVHVFSVVSDLVRRLLAGRPNSV